MEAIRQGATDEELIKRFPISLKTAGRYRQEVEHPREPKPQAAVNVENVRPGAEAKAINPTPQKKVESATATETVKLAVRGAAPTLIVLNGAQIQLDMYALEDCHRLFLGIKDMDPAIDDEFGPALKAAMVHVYRHIRDRVQRAVALATVGGDGDDEAGGPIAG